MGTHGISDYGFYGEDGIFKTESIPNLSKCKCGNEPLIKCKYDDTPGWRETSYQIFCGKCKSKVSESNSIERIIKEWNGIN